MLQSQSEQLFDQHHVLHDYSCDQQHELLTLKCNKTMAVVV